MWLCGFSKNLVSHWRDRETHRGARHQPSHVPQFLPHRQNRGKQLAGTGAPPPRLYFSQQKLATQGSHLLQPLKAHSLSVSVLCTLLVDCTSTVRPWGGAVASQPCRCGCPRSSRAVETTFVNMVMEGWRPLHAHAHAHAHVHATCTCTCACACACTCTTCSCTCACNNDKSYPRGTKIRDKMIPAKTTLKLEYTL